MAPEEERLLAEIDKLTKHPIERMTLEGLRVRERSERGERERRPSEGGSSGGRSSRSSTPEAARPAARDAAWDVVGQQAGPRAPRYASRARGHHEVVDDFFVKPYEPKEPDAVRSMPDAAPSAVSSVVKPARKIAALLGGSKKV